MKFGVDKVPTKMPYSGKGKAIGAIEKTTNTLKNRSKKYPPQKI